jgi:hypothetical protein
MTQTLDIPGPPAVGQADHPRPFGLFKELERPGDVFRDLGRTGLPPWIVLGPLGQSATAAGTLGTQAAHMLPAPYAAGAAVFALLYGVPTWGFAMMWLALAAAITVRPARRGLPFALTWWSFTFPVGTCVTGTIALAGRSGADVLRVASVVLFTLLAGAWLTIAARTVAGSATGRLFKCDLAGRGGGPGGWWRRSPGPCPRRRGSRGRPGSRGSRACPGCA